MALPLNSAFGFIYIVKVFSKKSSTNEIWIDPNWKKASEILFVTDFFAN